ncbi:MAG: HAD-IA family hydrolase, partial [Eubacterium sp.]|nr:HAD-IA family hydrolase [Eubacterium sp.]
LPLIDKISCGLDVTKSKPDPEVFLVAASKLELTPENCLVVEDAKAGIDAAKAGGMKSLGVGPFHEELGADFHSRTLATVDNWEEILC